MELQRSANSGGLDLNTVLNGQIQVNYVNPILYSVSVSNCPSPECGVLCILIGNLTVKSALLLFNILSASKLHFEKRPVIGNHIT